MSRLFVGNLPYSLSDEELKKHVVGLGVSVDDIVIIQDRETQRSKGFGFLTTSLPVDEAIAALDGTEVDGRRLRVNEAHERSRPAPRGPRHDDFAPPPDRGGDRRRGGGKKKRKRRRGRDFDDDYGF